MITLGDGTQIFDLLGDSPRKFDEHTIAFRIHGLVGDCIKATTLLSEMLKEDPSRKFVILVSYSDDTKKEIVSDLFRKLVELKVVIGLYFNTCQLIGNITYPQYSFLRSIGCTNIFDLYFHNSDTYKTMKTGIPYLGFANPLPNNNKIALFRYSGFHRHVPLRHISEEDWNFLEKSFIDLGLDVHLYGYDDPMKTLVKPENDHRKKLSVLGTIEHASDSGFCVSTTTFLPVYLHHFIPCLVYVDPIDVPATSLLWRSTHNYMPINTQMKDYLTFVRDFVSMWYRSNMNSEMVINLIKKEVLQGIHK